MSNYSYTSPFSTRYGSPDMRFIWSQTNRILTYQSVWRALAWELHLRKLVSTEQYDEIEVESSAVDLEDINQRESECGHELQAILSSLRSRCPLSRDWIHRGLTSEDVLSNGDAILQKKALEIVRYKLKRLIEFTKEKVIQYKSTPCVGWTHLQPAVPTTVGYRLTFTLQDLLEDSRNLDIQLRGKGIKGAVGNGGSLTQIPKLNIEEFEKKVMDELKLDYWPITNQTYPRKQDYLLVTHLASLAGTLHKLALDIRILQSPQFGEMNEQFGESQIGSSAMPGKHNPVMCENICSLARVISQYPPIMWGNFANSILERTLDDSASRRIIIPEAFLITDEILEKSLKVIEGLEINIDKCNENLITHGHTLSTESCFLFYLQEGYDREEARKMGNKRATTMISSFHPYIHECVVKIDKFLEGFNV